MARSVWKGPYIDLFFFLKKQDKILSISRKSKIIPKFLGMTFNIHKGNKYKKIIITEKMIGHKFGEFAFTRSFLNTKNESKN